MVALPVLAGALLRVVFGVLVDPLAARGEPASLGKLIVISACVHRLARRNSQLRGNARARADSRCRRCVVRRRALPLASRWYPPQYQGVALGHRRRRQLRHCVRVAVRTGHGRGRYRLEQRARACGDSGDGCVHCLSVRRQGQPHRSATEEMVGVPRRAAHERLRGGSCSSTR